jgi:hypothetical protein
MGSVLEVRATGKNQMRIRLGGMKISVFSWQGLDVIFHCMKQN